MEQLPPREAYHLPSPQYPTHQSRQGEPPDGPFGSAPKRALQLLRETQPLPARRRSVPLPPTGDPPPLLRSQNSGKEIAQASINSRSLGLTFPGKPLPPSTPPSAAVFKPGRRKSTGTIVKRSIPLGTVRPPPPRGPPPSAVGTTTNSTFASPTYLELRRRSSDVRGPPPGPPPPGRRLSTTSSPSPSAPFVDSIRTTLNYPQEDSLRAIPTASGMMGDIQGPDATNPRRVSFSAYRGPPPRDWTGEGNNVQQNITKQENDSGERTAICSVDAHTGKGAQAAVSYTPQSLPQLQQWRRSSRTKTSIDPGRPPPPRPQDGPSPEQIRRYSISNEFPGNFSRCISTINPVRESFDANTVGVSLGMESGDDARPASRDSSSNPLLAPFGKGGEGQSSTQRASPQGRAGILWYNMGVTRQKERDAKGAVECYDRAAKENHTKAQHNLAAIYEKGAAGVPKDEVEAVRLFRAAADQGLAESCYSLAMHLKFGLGVEQNDAQCVYYLEKASEHGLAKAIFNLGLMYEKHRGVSSEGLEEDLLEATRECYQAAAEAGITKAMVNLGVLYLSRRLPGREQKEALEWFKKAADEGDISGLWNLSLCYERGIGVERDALAAQALQQQCRERESENQPQQAGSKAAAAVFSGPMRRSSETALAFAPAPTGGEKDSVSPGDKKTVPRRRLSSVPSFTPPRPEGPPPARMASPDRHQNAQGEGTDGSEGLAAARGGATGYTFVPKEYDRPTDRRSSSGRPDAPHMNEIAVLTTQKTMDSTSPPLPERKDSFLLKPTSEAIARVKAAVERRKKREAAAVSAALVQKDE